MGGAEGRTMTDTSAFGTWLDQQFAEVPDILAREIALDVGISEGYLSALRSGRNPRPSVARARAIAGAFARRRRLPKADTQALVASAERAVAASHATVLPERDSVSVAEPTAPGHSRWARLTAAHWSLVHR
jgi:transcriptional regulator with XRE-family HTH domain